MHSSIWGARPPCGIRYAGRSADPCPLSSFLPVVVATAVEPLLGNNVPVPYLFMCDRTRRQSAVGKRWNSSGEKKDAVIDFPAEQRGFFARQANRFRSSISTRGILFGGNSLSPTIEVASRLCRVYVCTGVHTLSMREIYLELRSSENLAEESPGENLVATTWLHKKNYKLVGSSYARNRPCAFNCTRLLLRHTRFYFCKTMSTTIATPSIICSMISRYIEFFREHTSPHRRVCARAT